MPQVSKEQKKVLVSLYERKIYTRFIALPRKGVCRIVTAESLFTKGLVGLYFFDKIWLTKAGCHYVDLLKEIEELNKEVEILKETIDYVQGQGEPIFSLDKGLHKGEEQ